jgi:Tol biopolymer transport system component
VWSPDGRTFAYTARPFGTPLDGDIHLVGVDGAGDRTVVATKALEMDPDWSADGTWILFVRGPLETVKVWAVHPDGSGLRRLTTGNRPEGHPAWR